jgi:LysM repeat protein
MRGRSLVLLSAGLNVVLAAGWYLSRAHEPARVLRAGATNAPAGQPEHIRYLPIYRKQFFSWSDLNSTNYDAYIRGLRNIGCPEPTIRGIILSDVDTLYFSQRLLDLPDLHQQWWRPEGDTNYTGAVREKRDTLDRERRSLLTRLLGPEWVMTELAVRYPIPTPLPQLDGPVLGTLSDATKEAVYAVLDEYRIRLLIQPDAGTPSVLAQDEKDLRAKLATLLTQPQLEEFLLRNSQNAENWRAMLGDLKYFNATPDEFRSLFRATDSIDMQMQLLGDSGDPAVQQQLQSLAQQRDAAVRMALGPDRYAEYVRLQDPAYQAALEEMQEAGDDPSLLPTLYAINRTAAAEQARIDANSNLTDLQAQIEAKKAELAQLQAQAQVEGQTVASEPPPPPPPAPSTPTLQTHVIQPGETLADVAQANSTGVVNIEAVNPGVDFRNLKPGDTIYLPPTQPAPPGQ